MSDAKCPIWGTQATFYPTARLGREYVSARAGGKYFISSSAMAMAARMEDPERVRLTNWIVDQHRLGVECPEILTYTLERTKLSRDLSVQSRSDRLLQYMTAPGHHLGGTFDFSKDNAINVAMAYSGSLRATEVTYLLEQLELSGYLKIVSKGLSGCHVTVTVAGYGYAAGLDAPTKESSSAFVAMWFDESMDTLYNESIEPAIREAGYKPVRIDKKDHNNKIDDEIIAEIRRAKFIIADFTHGDAGMRGGVYYEAGFARGLGIDVISTCRQDLLNDNKIHFDTRQYNHIGWTVDKYDEFRLALSNRISATIGDGPLKVIGGLE